MQNAMNVCVYIYDYRNWTMTNIIIIINKNVYIAVCVCVCRQNDSFDAINIEFKQLFGIQQSMKCQ